MYFPIGFNPKTFKENSIFTSGASNSNNNHNNNNNHYDDDDDENDEIICLKFNPVHSLLCVLTVCHISIWSVQHDGFHLELREPLYSNTTAASNAKRRNQMRKRESMNNNNTNNTTNTNNSNRTTPRTPRTPRTTTIGIIGGDIKNNEFGQNEDIIDENGYLPSSQLGSCIAWKPFAEYSALVVRVNETNLCIYRVGHSRLSSDRGTTSYSNEHDSYNNSEHQHEILSPKLPISSLNSSITLENLTPNFIDVSTYGSISCMCTDQKCILVGTSIGYILVVLWTGEIVQAISPDFVISGKTVQQRSPRTRSVVENSVVAMVYKKRLNIYGAIFKDGTFCFMTQQKNSSNVSSVFLNFVVLHAEYDRDAVSLDLNDKQNIAAVGCRNGEVIIYQISSVGPQSETQQNHYSYHFSIRTVVSFQGTRGFTEKDLGSAKCVQFTSDGHALCIGYSKRGLALFHPSGTCIMSTLPMHADSYQYRRKKSSDDNDGASEIVVDNSEPFSSGVNRITWDSEAYHLVALSNSNTPNSGVFFSYSFYKSMLCRNSSQNLSYNPGIILQGADRVMLFHMTSDTDLVNADWDQLQLPFEYLVDNYPLKFVSISANGQQLAVAGRNGCALYNRTLRRWRMFGDLNQERATKCSGIVWIDNVVLAIVQRCNSQSGTEIVLYPRYHLDRSSILASLFVTKSRVLHVSSTIVYIPVPDERYGTTKRQVPLLFLYDASHKLHVLIARLTYQGKEVKADLSVLLTVDLSLKHKSAPLSMTTVQCYPSAEKESASETYQILSRAKVLFLHTDRTLTALVLQNLTSPNKPKEICLDSNVDCFWIESEKSFQNYGTYFTYHGSDKRGIKLSVQDLSILGSRRFEASKIVVHNLIPYDPDAFPLGIFKDAGIFLHASDAAMKAVKPFTSMRSAEYLLSYPYYELQPKMYPYAHGILLSLLLGSTDPTSQDVQDRLTKFASKLTIAKSNKPTFVATLEWMFHSVLSVDDTVSTAKITDSSASFPDKFCIMKQTSDKGVLIPLQKGLAPVVQFLRNLHLFYEVVVNCLRKTDIALWKRLFDILQESPRDMFQRCMDNNLVNEAANMLRILQQTEDLEYVKQSAYSLLRPALACFHYDRVRDMIRFIQMIETEQALILKEQQQQELENGQKKNEEKDKEDKQQAKQELLTAIYGPVISGWLMDSARLQSIIFSHCRELLLDANLFAILRLVESLELPFAKWLEQERETSANLEDSEDDWERTFSKIHQVFDLPRSSFKMHQQVLQHISQKLPSVVSSYSVQYFSFTQYRIFMIPELVSQLEFLFDSFNQAQCTAFALLLATLLCKVDSIVSIFRQECNETLWRCYHRMLLQEKNDGYRQLLKQLESHKFYSVRHDLDDNNNTESTGSDEDPI